MTPQRMDPHALAELFGVDIDHPKPKAPNPTKVKDSGSTNGQRPDQAQPIYLDWYPHVRKALEARVTPADRSQDAWNVLWACVDAELTLAQGEWVLRQRDDLAGWVHENPAGDLERTITKIRAQRQAQQPTAATESEDTKPRYVDIAAMLGGTLPEPPKPHVLTRQDGHRLFYKGRVNSLFGDSEVGKTWISLLPAPRSCSGTAKSSF